MEGLQNNIAYLNSKIEVPVSYGNQEWRGIYKNKVKTNSRFYR